MNKIAKKKKIKRKTDNEKRKGRHNVSIDDLPGWTKKFYFILGCTNVSLIAEGFEYIDYLKLEKDNEEWIIYNSSDSISDDYDYTNVLDELIDSLKYIKKELSKIDKGVH